MTRNAGATQAGRTVTKGNRRINLPKGITLKRGQYRVRWKTSSGSRQSKTFRTLEEAKSFKAQQRAEASLLRSLGNSEEPTADTGVVSNAVIHLS